jgi:Ca2+-binding RTX toxin-like protein
MSQTAGINMINLQFEAEEQKAIDRANGTYAANIAQDPKYYLWQGNLQTVPMGMDGNPEQFVAQIVESLPTVNTLRLQFNESSFNPDGSLNPLYERLIISAAEQGLKLVFVYADGDVQRLGSDGSLSSAQMYAALSGEVHDRMVSTWQAMLDWIEAHPGVDDAVYAMEIANEPAAYDRGVDMAPAGAQDAALDEFVTLYANQMVEISEIIQSRLHTNIMVGGWDYSANFDCLAATDVGGVSALDYIRTGIGDALIWSAHFYPGWHGTANATSVRDVLSAIDAIFAPLGNDNIIITETNVLGSTADLYSGPSAAYYFARAIESFAERGIGISWFPGVETGASNFVVIDANGSLRFLHQSSLAHGLNGFSVGEAPGEHAGGELVLADFVAGRLRNEITDPDFDINSQFDSVSGAGFGFGYGGNDTIIGADAANNFLYGGTGNDLLVGADNEDFLFGQGGDDTLLGNAGRDRLFGGAGNDSLDGGAGDDLVEGGLGSDIFVLSAGSDVFVDLDFDSGDVLDLNGRYENWADLMSHARYEAIDGATFDDLIIYNLDGTRTTLLNVGAIYTPNIVGLAAPRIVIGTAAADNISVGYTDASGNVFGITSQNVDAGNGSDTINGSNQANWLSAGSGNDLVFGAAGDDVIFGGDGNDTLSGGNGSDTVYGGNGHDVIVGVRGANYLYGDNGDDSIYSGKNNSVIDGGAGNDRIYLNLARAGHVASGGEGADTFILSTGKIRGATYSVITDFSENVDRLMFGGQVVDTSNLAPGYFGEARADGWLLTLPNGNTLLLQGFAPSQSIDRSVVPTYSSSGNLIVGTNSAERLIGTDEGDFVEAKGGNDVVYAGRGDDTIIGGYGNDRIYLGKGHDRAYGGAGNDAIYGQSGHNELYGGDGNDFIWSGRHSSLLSGGDGDDILFLNIQRQGQVVIGGAGSDTFNFSNSDGRVTHSIVTDFSMGEDNLVIAGQRIDLTNLPPGLEWNDTSDGMLLALDPQNDILFQGLHFDYM